MSLAQVLLVRLVLEAMDNTSCHSDGESTHADPAEIPAMNADLTSMSHEMEPTQPVARSRSGSSTSSNARPYRQRSRSPHRNQRGPYDPPPPPRPQIKHEVQEVKEEDTGPQHVARVPPTPPKPPCSQAVLREGPGSNYGQDPQPQHDEPSAVPSQQSQVHHISQVASQPDSNYIPHQLQQWGTREPPAFDATVPVQLQIWGTVVPPVPAEKRRSRSRSRSRSKPLSKPRSDSRSMSRSPITDPSHYNDNGLYTHRVGEGPHAHAPGPSLQQKIDAPLDIAPVDNSHEEQHDLSTTKKLDMPLESLARQPLHMYINPMPPAPPRSQHSDQAWHELWSQGSQAPGPCITLASGDKIPVRIEVKEEQVTHEVASQLWDTQPRPMSSQQEHTQAHQGQYHYEHAQASQCQEGVIPDKPPFPQHVSREWIMSLSYCNNPQHETIVNQEWDKMIAAVRESGAQPPLGDNCLELDPLHVSEAVAIIRHVAAAKYKNNLPTQKIIALARVACGDMYQLLFYQDREQRKRQQHTSQSNAQGYQVPTPPPPPKRARVSMSPSSSRKRKPATQNPLDRIDPITWGEFSETMEIQKLLYQEHSDDRIGKGTMFVTQKVRRVMPALLSRSISHPKVVIDIALCAGVGGEQPVYRFSKLPTADEIWFCEIDEDAIAVHKSRCACALNFGSIESMLVLLPDEISKAQCAYDCGILFRITASAECSGFTTLKGVKREGILDERSSTVIMCALCMNTVNELVRVQDRVQPLVEMVGSQGNQLRELLCDLTGMSCIQTKLSDCSLLDRTRDWLAPAMCQIPDRIPSPFISAPMPTTKWHPKLLIEQNGHFIPIAQPVRLGSNFQPELRPWGSNLTNQMWSTDVTESEVARYLENKHSHGVSKMMRDQQDPTKKTHGDNHTKEQQQLAIILSTD